MHPGRVLYVGAGDAGERGAEVLVAAGLPILRAVSGPDALKRLEDGDVDVVVCETRLPDVSLGDLLSTVRARRPSIPIFIVGSSDGFPEVGRVQPAASVEQFDAINDQVIARIREAIAVRRTERAVARHRRLKDAVRELAISFAHATTRTEVEEAIYRRLSAVGLYRFVWIGDLNAGSGSVRLRQPVEHLIDAGDLTAVFGCEAPGFIEEAVRTGTAATSAGSTAFRRPSAGSFRDAPDGNKSPPEDGSFTCIAVPLAVEGTAYGFLLLAVDRPTLDESERSVLDGLAVLAGNAIGSTDEVDQEED